MAASTPRLALRIVASDLRNPQWQWWWRWASIMEQLSRLRW